VRTKPQPESEAWSTFGCRSVSVCETIACASMPYFALACCMPSQLAWLKEWSSRPPESVTIRAQRPGAAEDAAPLGPASGAAAQPARARAAAAAAAGTRSFARRVIPPSCRIRAILLVSVTLS